MTLEICKCASKPTRPAVSKSRQLTKEASNQRTQVPMKLTRDTALRKIFDTYIFLANVYFKDRKRPEVQSRQCIFCNTSTGGVDKKSLLKPFETNNSDFSPTPLSSRDTVQNTLSTLNAEGRFSPRRSLHQLRKGTCELLPESHEFHRNRWQRSLR